MKARQNKVFTLNCDKVDRRIASKADHPDFLSYIIKNKQGVVMPIQELYANSTLIVLAGSESTASGLAGITFQLLKHPDALKKAIGEIRSAFTNEAEIEPEKVKRLSYLAAIVSEGLRMYPPFPEGLPRVTPRQGALICGQWVPGGVSYNVPSQSLLTFQSRLMCKLAPTRLIAAQPISKIQIPSTLNAGLAASNSRLITKKPPSPFLLVLVAVLAESKSERRLLLFLDISHKHIVSFLLTLLPPREALTMETQSCVPRNAPYSRTHAVEL